jgi:hypothetical protein
MILGDALISLTHCIENYPPTLFVDKRVACMLTGHNQSIAIDHPIHQAHSLFYPFLRTVEHISRVSPHPIDPFTRYVPHGESDNTPIPGHISGLLDPTPDFLFLLAWLFSPRNPQR